MSKPTPRPFFTERKDNHSIIEVEDLYKTHQDETFRDYFLLFVAYTEGKTTDVQRMLLKRKELYNLYQKIGDAL